LLLSDVDSLDTKNNFDETLGDTIESDCNVEQSVGNKVFFEQLDALISSLVTDREHAILLGRITENRTLTGLGEECGISTERVHQVYNEVLGCLRDHPMIQQYHSENQT